jgi:hypothetical protein
MGSSLCGCHHSSSGGHRFIHNDRILQQKGAYGRREAGEVMLPRDCRTLRLLQCRLLLMQRQRLPPCNQGADAILVGGSQRVNLAFSGSE